MYFSQVQFITAATLSYAAPQHITLISHALSRHPPSLPPAALPLISAAAIFLSRRCIFPASSRRPSVSHRLPLSRSLTKSSRRLRHTLRRLSVHCKRHLSLIVKSLHSATLQRSVRISFPVSAVAPLPPHYSTTYSSTETSTTSSKTSHYITAPPTTRPSRTMCQSPVTHEDHFASPRFDPTASQKCEEVTVPSSPKSDDPSSPCYHRDSLISKTLTLYDWDDTFFPSTYLAARGVRIDENDQLPQNVMDELEELEAIVIKILQEALRCGVVKVITNAEEGWVELSGNRFMPKLTEFLRINQIKIVSARTIYEAEYPDSPSCWKTAAFAAEVDESYPDADELNVLVLGDSLSEREAAHNLALRKPTSYVKSVKLVERPNVTQLRRQIALLHGSFRELREHYGSFDVNLTC